MFQINVIICTLCITYVMAVSPPQSSNIVEKGINKRSLSLYSEYPSIFDAITDTKFSSPYSTGPWIGGNKHFAPSPTAVANSIAAAKQASANVLIAQQQVQAAKDHVLAQQRIAMEKEAAATLQAQKSEALAAVQRSEAAAAAQAVILAQQRLAAAKAAVAHHQRIAAAKEAEAASALQNSAHAAAAEIQRIENDATKVANLQRNGLSAAAHYLSTTKDVASAPITLGSNHIPNLNSVWPSSHFSTASTGNSADSWPTANPSKTLTLWG